MIRLIAFMLAACLVAGCSDRYENPPVEVTSVALKTSSLALLEGDSVGLVATALPEYADNLRIAWSSSDEAVARVDASGKVAAVGAGTATVTARSHNDMAATCEVAVTGVIQRGVAGAVEWIFTVDNVMILRGKGDMKEYPTPWDLPWADYRKQITGVVIDERITSLCDSAFEDFDALTAVTIPDGVTHIGDLAFAYCEELASVSIPGSVTSFGTSAFWGCGKLTSITIPDGVSVIDVLTFSNCSGLKSVTLPNSVTMIAMSAFVNCSGLTDVTLSGALTDIGMHAFRNCSGLTSLTIPGSVTRIDSYAFEDCRNLSSVTILATTPPAFSGGNFIANTSDTLYVPRGCVEAYQTNFLWNSAFTTIVEQP